MSACGIECCWSCIDQGKNIIWVRQWWDGMGACFPVCYMLPALRTTYRICLANICLFAASIIDGIFVQTTYSKQDIKNCLARVLLVFLECFQTNRKVHCEMCYKYTLLSTLASPQKSQLICSYFTLSFPSDLSQMGKSDV